MSNTDPIRRCIRKYHVNFFGYTRMPRHSRILRVELQGAEIFVLAEVIADNPLEETAMIDIVSTGGQVPDGEFINTFTNTDKSFVAHAYLINPHPDGAIIRRN